MNENIIQEKSYNFALKIIALSKRLNKNREYVISKQILKCGTSIGANVEEAIGGQSQKDFRAKLFIAYKEARETNYWVRLLRDSETIEVNEAENLVQDSHELKRILGAILTTLSKK